MSGYFIEKLPESVQASQPHNIDRATRITRHAYCARRSEKNRHSASPAPLTQDTAMTQFTHNAQDTETSSQYAGIRLAELIDQCWSRNKSAGLARCEGISLNDEHWAVISYLRSYYVGHGLPKFARTTARALNRRFAAKGGSKYLYRLFAGGPVTKGSRLANLRSPARANGLSFGTLY
jgi:tRNA 2-thiouridine synthesizing protein E